MVMVILYRHIGGGKCQISTTLYNAVLNAPNLTVVERHEHSGPVYYVPEGMDACVAYGSCDFKFRNDNNFDIKMYVSNTPDSIDISLVILKLLHKINNNYYGGVLCLIKSLYVF